MSQEFLSHSVQETRAIGASISSHAVKGDVFALIGEIGCVKTEFVRGFVEKVCGTGAVRSPTYSIVNIHESQNVSVFHFDFYRLKKREELLEIGYYDYICSDGIVLIEWADMFPDVLPRTARSLQFVDMGENARRIILV